MKIKKEPAVPAGGGVALTLAVKDLKPARDNVHAAERKGDETFRGLVESVRANGLIHRIVVRPDPDAEGRYVVVDGHRRLEAAKAAGMSEVPCEVRDVGADASLALTVAANVQRLENDPVLEAEAICKMLRSGMSAREVAAAIGKGEGYVARRARLVHLADPWRKFAKRIRCTADMLEKVAAHERSLQERVAASAGLDEYEEDGGDPCGWGEFEDAFRAAMRRLDEAAFDAGVCARCPNNTASHAFLFDWMETEEGNAPRCMDAACYARRHNAAVDAQVEALRRAGTPAKEVDSKWTIPNHWDVAESRDRKHPQAYVYENDGLRHVLWGIRPERPSAKGRDARTAEEREAEKAEKRRAKIVRSARGKMRDAWGGIAGKGAEAVRERLGAAAYDALSATSGAGGSGTSSSTTSRGHTPTGATSATSRTRSARVTSASSRSATGARPNRQSLTRPSRTMPTMPTEGRRLDMERGQRREEGALPGGGVPACGRGRPEVSPVLGAGRVDGRVRRPAREGEVVPRVPDGRPRPPRVLGGVSGAERRVPDGRAVDGVARRDGRAGGRGRVPQREGGGGLEAGRGVWLRRDGRRQGGGVRVRDPEAGLGGMGRALGRGEEAGRGRGGKGRGGSARDVPWAARRMGGLGRGSDALADRRDGRRDVGGGARPPSREVAGRGGAARARQQTGREQAAPSTREAGGVAAEAAGGFVNFPCSNSKRSMA